MGKYENNINWAFFVVVVVANLTVIPQHFCLETPDDVFLAHYLHH